MYRQFLFTTIFLLQLITFTCTAQNYNLSDTVVTTCSGNFYDDGGPAGNYGLNQTHTMTFNSGNGNRLQFDFISLITVYGLNVYDGTNTSAPLIGTYGSGITPFTVQSSGTSLTFEFTTGNVSAQSAGWVATISCTTPPVDTFPMNDGQTITACEGIFYDDGGPGAAYTGSQTSIMTFCPATSNNYLVFNFPYQFALGLGDTLFVYSGTSTSSTPIGIYAGDNSRAYISSPIPGGCLTFKFVSDGFDNSAGWQGFLSCNGTPVYTMNMISGTILTCSGFFYDSGGPAGNYKPNKTSVVTFISNSGCSLQADFGSLTTTYGLNIYDGTSIAAPLIGSYGTGLAPFTVQSTGSALTFEFNTGSVITQSTGWGAFFSCPTTTNDISIVLQKGKFSLAHDRSERGVTESTPRLSSKRRDVERSCYRNCSRKLQSGSDLHCISTAQRNRLQADKTKRSRTKGSMKGALMSWWYVQHGGLLLL